MGGQRHVPAALPPGKTRYPLYRRLGEHQGRSGRVWKIPPPTGIRSPDRPARSEIYRLSYRGPPIYTDWSLVQKSPTDCGASLYVIKKPRKRGGYSPAKGLQNTNPQWVVAPGEYIYIYELRKSCGYETKGIGLFRVKLRRETKKCSSLLFHRKRGWL